MLQAAHCIRQRKKIHWLSVRFKGAAKQVPSSLDYAGYLPRPCQGASVFQILTRGLASLTPGYISSAPSGARGTAQTSAAASSAARVADSQDQPCIKRRRRGR